MSYSQHGEDQFIIDQLKKYQITPLVVDVGAGDGLMFSNSRALIESHNFDGILFEPSPEPFKLLEKLYKGTPIRCINQGVSGSEYRYIIKHNPRGTIDHWTLNSITMNKRGKMTIRLPKYLTENHMTKVGVLSIDTEGLDTTIIRDLIENSTIRPDVIIIETDEHASFEEQKEILSDYDLVCNTSSYNHIFFRKDLQDFPVDLHSPELL